VLKGEENPLVKKSGGETGVRVTNIWEKDGGDTVAIEGRGTI